MQVPELFGGANGLGWVAVKAVRLFAVAVIGLRLGERRTLAQLSSFDFAVAVAIGAIIGRGATASDTSFATSATALITLLVAHRVVAIGRRHSRVVRLIDHPPRVLVAGGELQGKELARAGLTAADVHALLREHGVGDLDTVTIAISGPVTRTWQLVATAAGWEYRDEPGARVVARLSLTTEQAWRLLTNNLPATERSRLITAGDDAITGGLLSTRAIIGSPKWA